jgi:hypothetical protein
MHEREETSERAAAIKDDNPRTARKPCCRSRRAQWQSVHNVNMLKQCLQHDNPHTARKECSRTRRAHRGLCTMSLC